MKKSAKKRRNRLTLEQRVINIGNKVEKLKKKGVDTAVTERLKLKALNLADLVEKNNKPASKEIMHVSVGTIITKVKVRTIPTGKDKSKDIAKWSKSKSKGVIYAIPVPESVFDPTKITGYAPTQQDPKKPKQTWELPENWGTGKVARNAKKRAYKERRKAELTSLCEDHSTKRGKRQLRKVTSHMKPKQSDLRIRLDILLVYFSQTKGVATHHRKLVTALKKFKTEELAKPMADGHMKRILKKRKKRVGNNKPDKIARREAWSDKRKTRDCKK